MIFEAVSKWNGQATVDLTVSEVKQIGGRAGRYKTSHDAINESTSKQSAVAAPDENLNQPAIEIPPPKSSNVGYVTSLTGMDFPMLRRKMNAMPEPIRTAGILPPDLIVERFSNYFPPGTPFSYILLRLHAIASTHERYHICDLKDTVLIADCIQPLTNLTVQDRLAICSAPANMRQDVERVFMYTLAEVIAEGKSGELLDLPNLNLEILNEEPSGSRDYLRRLEDLHKNIVLYLWLSFRFPNVFTTRSLAEHTKKIIEGRIEACLQNFSFVPSAMKAARRKIKQAKLQAKMVQSAGAIVEQSAEKKSKGDKAGVLTGFNTDDVDVYPTDAIDDPNLTMSEIHRHRQSSRLQHAKLRFGDFASIGEISGLARGYRRRVQLLERDIQDVKTGYVSGIDLNVDPPALVRRVPARGTVYHVPLM